MPLLLLAALLLALPATAHARTFEISSAAALTTAAGQAQAGDVLRLAAGTYRGTLRPLTSGTAANPIRLVASGPGVVLDGGGAANAVKLIGVRSWRLEGVTITGGVNQGVWIEGTQDVQLRGVTVTGNAGAGVQLRNAQGTTVADGTVSDNGSAGVMEDAGSRGTRIAGNRIERNGVAGGTYNGDGIQLGGTGATVIGNALVGNGGAGLYEHGVYTGASSSGWTIAANAISASGGANIKASGTGVVRDNHLDGGTHGLVLASNPGTVEVTGNWLTGRSQHLVFVTTGARARLTDNTIRQAGRAADSGDASAIFVKEAASLQIASTTACYDNADNLGVGLWINNAAAVGTLSLDANRYCSRDTGGRHTAYNGSRVTADKWRSLTGDALSTFG